MNKLLRCYVLVSIVLFLFIPASGQNSTNYTINNFVNGSLSADMNGNTISTVSAPDLMANTVTNSITALQPIGFDFFFMGKYYSHFVCTDDGAIALGVASSPTAMLFTNIANDLTRTVSFPSLSNNAPVLAPFWDNIRMPNSGPTIRKIVTGTAPNRCLVIEYNVNINTSSSATNATGQFQVRLYETTGVIEYVYGSMTIGPASGVVTASIGFSAGSTDGSFLALTNLSTFTFTSLASQEPASQSLVNSNIAGPITALHSVSEGNRRIFRFSPPVLTGGPLGTLDIGGIGATTTTLGWVDTYSNEGGYSVFISTDNVNFNLIGYAPANATTFKAYNLTLGTTYYWKVIASTEGNPGNFSSGSNITSCGMNGVYSVGTGGNFSNLTNAIDSLRILGISGNTTWELLPGYSSASEVYPITFPKNAVLPCVANDRRLTIRPATGANITMRATGTNAVFLLDSCQYVTIDGRIGSTGTTSSLTLTGIQNIPSIQLTNASYNVIRYVKLSGTDNGIPAINGLINISGTKASGCDNNLIEGCTFYSTLTLFPKQIYLNASTTGGILNDNNTVQNCNFSDVSQNAIYLGTGTNGWNILDNSFYNQPGIRTASTISVLKIDYDINSEYNIIYGNYFGGSGPRCTGNPVPIDHKSRFYFIEAVGKANIFNNYFRRIKFNNTTIVAAPAIIGIRLSDGTRSFNGTISNNEFGGIDPADSINFTQNFTNNLSFGGIASISPTGGRTIQGNHFNNIRSYSATGTVQMEMISSGNSSAVVQNNIIGDPSIPNSIVNSTNAPTRGIYFSQSYIKATDNIISNITGTSTGNNAIVIGIATNTCDLDSISRNDISHLQTHAGNGSLVACIGGISCTFTSFLWSRVISGNRIYALNYLGTGSVNVVGIVSQESLTITGNQIYSFSSSGAQTTNYGINMSGGIIENNMVHFGLDSLGNNIVQPLRFTGIYGGNNVRHNSVMITGSNVASSNINTICFFSPGISAPVSIFNNIFYNDRNNVIGTGSNMNICMWISAGTGPISIDYNLFYAGSPTSYTGYLSSSYSTLANWQASGYDLNSIEGDPLFINPTGNSSNLNLHLQPGSPAESKGSAVQTIAIDIDGQNRNTLTPVDIGADAGNFSVCPLINAGSDTTICSGASVQLGSPSFPGVTYSWTANPSGFISAIANPVVNPDSTISYYLNVTGSCSISDTITVSVNQLISPTIFISTNDTSVCAGASVDFIATSSNEGSTPSYQWKVNGNNVGSNSNFYSSSAISNGDVILAELTSNASCIVTPYATSNSLNMMVSPFITPSVSVSVFDTSVCAGTTVVFTSTQVNGGSSPSYQWKLNGNNVGTDSSAYKTSTITNNDVISVIMTSSAKCVTSTTASGNDVIMKVNPLLTPSVSIYTGDSSICDGKLVTFLAIPVNGGNTPSYQWMRNGNRVGSDTSIYSTNTLADGDVISTILTSNASCVTRATANSNNQIMQVKSFVSPGISIAGNVIVNENEPTTLSSSTIDGGNDPSYQWQDSTQDHGWQNITNANSVSINYIPIQTGNKIRVIMSSNADCAISAQAISNALTFTVNTATPGLPGNVYGISYSPNPAYGSIKISNLKLSDKWQTLKIAGANGSQILSPMDIRAKTNINVPLDKFSKGLYVLVFQSENGHTTYIKFIKL
jgi:hypothetical protein